MSISNKHQIPLFVVSGGILEVIESAFLAILDNGELHCDHARACWAKMGILSNSFVYENEITIDYKKPILHILNKQQFIYENTKEMRKNVIVMGDILEDVKMID